MENTQDFTYLYNQIEENRYDFGTGAWAVVNEKFAIKLNNYGEYFSYVDYDNLHNLSKNEVNELMQTNLLLSDKNETDISKKLFSEIQGMKYDKRLGYYSDLYVGHVTEGDYRQNGSSGGFGTWIFKELLENDIIDGVIHVKESTEDVLFKYDISRTIEEVIAGAKTKYYPVEYSQVLKTVLENPGRYAIIGLPSYIMNLRLLAENNSVLQDSIKIAIGLVCGHQKSTKFSEFLAWQCGIEPGNLKNINFRKKLDTSPSSSYAIEVTGMIDGHETKIIKKMSDLVGGDWGQGFFKVRASDFTDDVMNETADVTLGDAWLKEYINDSQGNNILIVRNPIIKRIIEQGISKRLISLKRVDAEVIFESQEAHFRQTRDELKYRLYKKEKKNSWIPIKRVQPSNDLTWSRKLIQDKRENICNRVPKIYRNSVKKNNINYFLRRADILSKEYGNIYRIKRIMNSVKKVLKKVN